MVVLRQPDAPEDLICKRIVLEAGEKIPNNWNIFRELSVVSSLFPIINFSRCVNEFLPLALFKGSSWPRVGGRR